MKIIVLYCLACIVFLCCAGCQDSPNFFSNRVKQIEPSSKTRLIAPDTVFQAGMGAISFVLADGKFVYSVNVGDTLFYVYDGNEFLGSFGQRGRGDGEFLNTIYCGQNYHLGDTVGIWFNDMMQQEMKLVDISSSLKQNKAVVVKTMPTFDMGIASFILNDSMVLAQEFCPSKKNVNLVTYNVVNKRRITQSFYAPTGLDVFSVYSNVVRMRPGGDKVVAAMCNFNQVNILSLKDSSRIAVTSGNPVLNRLEAIGANWRENATTLFYMDLAVTDDYIFALYVNQPFEDVGLKTQPVFIYVLDWEGNLRQCFEAPEYLSRIAVDSRRECLYGLSFVGEKVYRYSLKGFL